MITHRQFTLFSTSNFITPCVFILYAYLYIACQLGSTDGYLLFMLLFSLNISLFSTDGNARVPAGFIMANVPWVRPRMRAHLCTLAYWYAGMRACNYLRASPPPLFHRPYPPIRADECTHNYLQEGAIINLGITPQTYMPRCIPSRDIPRRGEDFRFLDPLILKWKNNRENWLDSTFYL